MIILKQFMNSKSVNQLSNFVFLLKRSFIAQLKLIEIKKIIKIIIIEVVIDQTLVKNKKIKIFLLNISEINKVLSSVESFLKLNETIFVILLKKLKKLKNKLLIVYHDFLNVFDKEKTTQLSSHQSYDHKIELKDKSQLFKS